VAIFWTARLNIPHAESDPTTSNDHNVVLCAGIFRIDYGCVETDILEDLVDKSSGEDDLAGRVATDLAVEVGGQPDGDIR